MRKTDIIEIGYDELIAAIYRQAVKDYKKILASKYIDVKEKREIEEFLVSGAYGFNPKTGRKIIEHCNQEIHNSYSYAS
jgi:hypothetical protein